MDDCIYYMLIDNYSQLPRTMEKTFPVYNEYIYNESNVNLPSELISVVKLSFFLCLLALCILFSCYSISYYSFIQCCDMYSYNNIYRLYKYLHDEFNLATANSHISLLLNSEIFLWNVRNIQHHSNAFIHLPITYSAELLFFILL